MFEHKLTICSVSFKSAEYLNLNWELVRHLNPTAQFTWIVTENSPPGAENRLETQTDRFSVLDGCEFDGSKPFPKGHHHGEGLNNALPLAKTRFLLALDPDFYIVRDNWIDEIIAHMRRKNLTFFGAPHYPGKAHKYRYFPTIMCILIDLEQVEWRLLDFRPGDQWHPRTLELKRERQALREGLEKRDPGLLRGMLVRGKRFLGRPWYFGSVQDTGHRLYERFYRTSHKSECVRPVYRPASLYSDLYSTSPKSAKALLKKMVHSPPLLPEYYSVIPKKRDYYTESGFREAGYPDTTLYGWEEHMWRRTPFGFHVKRHSRLRGAHIDSNEVARILARMTGLPYSQVGSAVDSQGL